MSPSSGSTVITWPPRSSIRSAMSAPPLLSVSRTRRTASKRPQCVENAQPTDLRTRSTTASAEGMARSSSASAEGRGMCGRGDPHHRPVEVEERLLGDDRRHLGAPAGEAGVLLDREQVPGLRRPTSRMVRGVERHQRADVDHLGVDAVARPAGRRHRPRSGPWPRGRRSVTSAPGRTTLASPRRSTTSPSGTSPLVAYSALGSSTITGSSSRTAAANSPMMSTGVDGTTTLRPGIDAAQVSTLCECWAPNRDAAAVGRPDHQRQASPGRWSCSGPWRSGWR